MAAKTPDKTGASDFLQFARKIDSEVDEKLEDTLQFIEIMNLVFENRGGGKFIPVGSCIDGSKVSVPGNSGDIDILIVSDKIVLSEELFVYDNRYPAFLYIRADGEHRKYFHETQHLIDGKYLPVSILKQLHGKFFGAARFLVKRMTAQGVSNEGDFFNVTRHSSVGLEKSLLDLETLFSLGVEDESQNLDFHLTRLGKFGQQSFNKIGFNTIDSIVSNIKYCSHQDILKPLITCGKQFQNSICTLATEDKKDENSKQTKEKRINIKQSAECEKQTSNEFVPERERISKSLEYSDIDYQNDFDSDNETDETFSTQSQKEYDVLGKENMQNKENILFHRFSSVDFVPAFRFEGWPRTAEEWIYRKRLWPSKRTMKEVIDTGCQVVAKRPFALNSHTYSCNSIPKEANDPYFRLSFALSEIILAKTLSEQQKLCWRVLKAYQKAYLGTNPRVLTSYHWKNVIFWISEEVDPLCWSDINVIDGVRRSLDFVVTCLRQKCFPFYFVRKMNLLNGCNKTAINETCTRVEMIKSKPFEYLKNFLKFKSIPEHVAVTCDEIEKIMSSDYAAQQADSTSNDMLNDLDSYKTRDTLTNIENNQKSLKSIANAAKKQLLRKVGSDIHASEDRTQVIKLLEAVENYDNKNRATWNEVSESVCEILKRESPEIEASLENEPEHVKEYILSATKSFPKLLSLFSSVYIEGKNPSALIEECCNLMETVGKGMRLPEDLLEETDILDNQTKEKINAVLSLSDTYSLLVPHLQRLFRSGIQIPRMFAKGDERQSRNETEIEIELD